MIRRTIDQSEARTRLFTVEQNNSVLQTAKLNKSVKNERISNSELMAANSKISRVYVQANYEKDKQLQKIIRLLQKRDSSQIARLPLLGGKSLTPLASIQRICCISIED